MQNSKFSFFLAIHILFFLSFLRFEVGTDWTAYFNFYNGSELVEKLEISYRILNNFMSENDFPYFLFLALISGITLVFIYQTGIRIKYKMIYLFIYFSDLFLYYNLSGMRQGVAIAMTLFATRYILTREFNKFLLLILLASTFHISALIYIIAYFGYYYKLNLRKILFLLLTSIFLLLFLKNIVDFFLDYLDYGNLYYYLALSKINDNNTINFIIGIFKRSVILIIFFLLPNHLKNNYGLSSFIKIYCIGFFIYILFYTLSEDIGTRLASYFLIMDVLIISIYFQLSISIRFKLMIFFTILIMYMYKLYGYSNIAEYSYKVFL